jgi:hypothetical protein
MVHLYTGISNCEFIVWFCLIFGVLSGWTGKELLHRKLWMKLFHIIFFIMQLICVYYIIEKNNDSVLVLNGKKKKKRDNGSCKGGFSVDSFLYCVQSCVWKYQGSLLRCTSQLQAQYTTGGCLVQKL